jgi:hypothetical protein
LILSNTRELCNETVLSNYYYNKVYWRQGTSSISEENAMNKNKAISLILYKWLFILILFFATGVQAAPLLLPMDEDIAPDSKKVDGTLYALNTEMAIQLWQDGSFSNLILPVNGQEVEFQQTERLVRTKNLTWKGVSSSGLLTALLTLGKDHIYGQVFGTFGTVKIAPETGNTIRVKLLDSAKETVSEHDILLPHMSTLDSEPASATKTAEDGSRIDVMVLYTDGLAAAHPGEQINTLIQNLVDQSNLVFSNSAINTQFNLVHAARVSYPDDNSMIETLEDLTDNIGVFDGVEELRSLYGADQVTLLRQYVDEGCGMAWVMRGPAPRYAYAVVHVGKKTDGSGYYCSDLTYVHEIGHNLGCAHDRANASITGRYDYSYGYQSPSGAFRTVMAYNCSGGCPQVPYFSNPDLQYNEQPLGVLHTASDSADNARTINQTRVEMANYRAPAGTTYTLSVTKQGTDNGTVTSNPSGISCGSTCSAAFSSGQSVTLTATAATGSTFAGWSGACTGTGSCTVSMTQARSVTATFNAIVPTHSTVLHQVYQLLLNQE